MRKSLVFAVASALVFASLAPATASAEARIKNRDEKGQVPKKWDLPKPAESRHPDVAPPTAGGWGDGYNNISFTDFDSGDLVVVLGTSTGHAGLFDRGYYSSLYSYAVWSANTTPRNGVQREQCAKYRTYDRAYALWVPYLQGYASSARYYARAQNGEPYNIGSSKTNTYQWYCSKLAWAAWRYTSGVDLDYDGGYWVWPIDLVLDSNTALFGFWN